MTVPTADLPIGDYALISDCHSAALVSRHGSIDWACLRRFDSASTFARLLDHDRGGFFSIRPVAAVTGSSRRYVGATMVLETTFVTDDGTIVLTDAFAMRAGGGSAPRGQLLRRVEATSGAVEVEVVIEPRFDYGSVHPWLQVDRTGHCTAVGGEDALAIHASEPLHLEREAARLVGRYVVTPQRRFAVTMLSQPAHLLQRHAADAGDVDDRLDETLGWWARWSTTTTPDGPYSRHVERSALVLKALCCAPTGAVIAAPTTSLPEIPGGAANWDYRFCWIRDATLTLEALSAVGHPEVAQGFRDFVMRSSAGRGDELQIMYGAYGERRLPEVELDLAGWRGSRPVRVGNGAAKQVQLDAFGHLLEAAHLWHRRSVSDAERHRREPMVGGIDEDEWSFLRSTVDEAANRRNDPDSGIWELRGLPRHYVHSKVMVWVALDRGIRLVEDHELEASPSQVDAWKAARDEVRSAIETRGVHPGTGAFVQAFGSTEVDASLLKLPLVGFVDANDPRLVATVEAIERDLTDGPSGFLRRFRGDHNDGLTSGDEGIFLLCSFWLVEVLAMQGRLRDATLLFERLLAVGNDLALFAEEYHPATGELLGNFPQAFTHLGIISAAQRLSDAGRAASPRR
jgi:GH15 family glucan-1,4-alpha-glucosidase